MLPQNSRISTNVFGTRACTINFIITLVTYSCMKIILDKNLKKNLVINKTIILITNKIKVLTKIQQQFYNKGTLWLNLRKNWSIKRMSASTNNWLS